MSSEGSAGSQDDLANGRAFDDASPSDQEQGEDDLFGDDGQGDDLFGDGIAGEEPASDV
jgi:hypothetical protein